ncbi:MAG: glycosyltransferase family A protein [Steroidobacteraceae bacterium]|nr:glycosyltransferase family A protein [Steroidobacteraceae bacterium]
MERPVVSLVVSSRNRARALPAHFDAIRGIRSTVPWEYIIVDNGSTDETPTVITSFTKGFHGECRGLSEPRLGASWGRNTGWTEARGSIIAFTDDDCYPSPDFVDNVARCFDEFPDLAFLGGRITLHDPTDLPITIQTSMERKLIPPYSVVRAGLIQSANLAIRRDALLVHGGYDVRLGAGTRFSAEDIELTARLSSRGLTGLYDPRPHVAHHHRRKTAEEGARLIREYDRGRGAYYLWGICVPSVRKQFIRHWLRSMRYRPLRKSAREIAGAVEFLWRHGIPRSAADPGA